MREESEKRTQQKDWSEFVSGMLAIATLLTLALEKFVSIRVAAAVAGLFLALWSLYFLHPRVQVVES